ncbi:alanine/glycine:cation symporter family protein [Candidatus Dependentiae bacterium]
MNLVEFFSRANEMLGIPAAFIFLSAGIILTLKTRFVQFRALPQLWSFITKGFGRHEDKEEKTISSFHAMFAAMATSLGMGNIVGPSIAIVMGGPGALFWLVAYTFFGGVTRFTETSFAMFTRKKTEDGHIISGPIQYLKLVHKWVANWYAVVMIIVFAVWSGTQANTLANILAKEGVPQWWVGIALAIIVSIVLHGGAKRVGLVASKLVPFMFILYLLFALWVLLKDFAALQGALKLIFSSIFSPAAPLGAFVGSTVVNAMRAGIFQSIYITEAGMGTSSIAHSMSDAKKNTDQGLLAMYSIVADAFLSFLSGLIIIVTGVWCIASKPDSTLIYTAFKQNTPVLGGFILIVSIALFVTTTVIGNSFNGMQSFASFTKHKGIEYYKIFTAIMIFLGSIMSMPLVWQLVGVVITFVAVPNVVSLVILAFKKPHVLDIHQEKSSTIDVLDS